MYKDIQINAVEGSLWSSGITHSWGNRYEPDPLLLPTASLDDNLKRSSRHTVTALYTLRIKEPERNN